ncbi:hypothetical protein [Nocardia sp. NPDC057227]|uniref:hypothetical protein n=1 Tax=Nocardia sp. NPDC057227 TaxID=3346056 RepID=UPI003641FAE6
MSEPQRGILTVDEAGGVGWWSRRVPVLPPVQLAAGGLTVRVDPAYPEVPAAWVLEPGIAPGVLELVFGAAAPPDLVAALVADGESVSALECPPLTPAWRRRATVAAVARWTTRRLNHGALLLDRAVAEHAVGNPAAAGRLFRLGEYALRDLGERGLAGTLPEPAAEPLRAALAAAEACGLAVGGLRAEPPAPPLSDVTLAALLSEWGREAALSAVPMGTTLGGEATGPASAQALLDLTAIPPRIIAWHGARAPELAIERQPDESCVLTANLAAGVDPDCREAGELLAYAAEQATGRIIEVSAADVRGNAVVAVLPLHGNSLDALAFGLFDPDTKPDELRAGPIGRSLAEIDRYLIEGWNQRRIAAVATADGGSAVTALIAARRAVGNAVRTLEALPPAAESLALTARRTAVADYLTVLREAATAPADLLLSDLLPPEDEA